MNKEDIWIVVGIVGIYYFFHLKGMTATSKVSSIPQASSARSVSTVSSSASTAPQTRVLGPKGTRAQAGNGTGFIPAPVRSIAALNNPRRQAPGSAPQRGRRSASWGGVGTAGISPTWPTTQVTSTKQIRVGSGQVQVPSYTAIPTVTRGPGGAGSVLNFGGM